MEVTPVYSFHSFSQPGTRQNLSMHETKRAIEDQRNNLTSFIMNRKLTTSGVNLAAEKAESNRGRGRGSGPSHTPKKVGLDKSRHLGRLAEREADNKDDDIMGDLEYR